MQAFALPRAVEILGMVKGQKPRRSNISKGDGFRGQITRPKARNSLFIDVGD